MPTPGGEFIEGLVLCRVGGDRLAIHAREVTGFEPPDESEPYAGAGFDPAARAPREGKSLRHHDARWVVDAVEVHPERFAVLPVPLVLVRAWGGALCGFVEAGGLLWPLVSLERLAAVPEASS